MKDAGVYMCVSLLFIALDCVHGFSSFLLRLLAFMGVLFLQAFELFADVCFFVMGGCALRFLPTIIQPRV